MENREAFTGILAEPEESVEGVNWRQTNYNQRGRSYSNRGSNRDNYRGSNYQHSPASRGSGYNTMEVTQEIMVKQRKQVLQLTQM